MRALANSTSTEPLARVDEIGVHGTGGCQLRSPLRTNSAGERNAAVSSCEHGGGSVTRSRIAVRSSIAPGHQCDLRMPDEDHAPGRPGQAPLVMFGRSTHDRRGLGFIRRRTSINRMLTRGPNEIPPARFGDPAGGSRDSYAIRVYTQSILDEYEQGDTLFGLGHRLYAEVVMSHRAPWPDTSSDLSGAPGLTPLHLLLNLALAVSSTSAA